MKKALILLLAFVVTLSSFGFSITIGYCPMKHSHSVSFTNKTTCCCKNSTEKGCCKSHQIHFKKVVSNYLASVPVSILAHSDFIVSKCCSLTQNHFYCLVSQNLLSQNTDPPEPHVPLNILYRSILV